MISRGAFIQNNVTYALQKSERSGRIEQPWKISLKLYARNSYQFYRKNKQDETPISRGKSLCY